MTASKKVLTTLGAALAALGLAAAGLAAAPCAMADGASDDASKQVTRTTKDQWYEFNFLNFGDWDNSHPAPKEDTTPTYLTVLNMTIYDIHLYTYGGYTPWHSGSSWTNTTCGLYGYLVDPGPCCIHNNTYEWGYPYEELWGLSSEAGEFWGWWSPDSWGTYTAINVY